jgi:hypothetical protein
MEETRLLIASELAVGDSAEEIESFLQKNFHSYGWDAYNRRFDATLREVRPYHSIIARIYVDDENRFTHAEVVDHYYGLP